MEIYVLINGEQAGPFSKEDIQTRITSGELTESTLAWREGVQDWLPLAALLSTIEAPPEQTPAVQPQTPPAPADASNQVSEVKTEKKSFGAKLMSLGGAAWHEAQRAAHLTSLKAQIEKAKLVDLRHAHYAIGKAAYMLSVQPDRFQAQYDEITCIKQEIETKRAGVSHSGEATTADKLKDAALSAKMRVEAEAAHVKLGQKFTILGHDVEDHGACSELQTELNAIQTVRDRMTKLEQEYVLSATDHTAKDALGTIAHSIAIDTGAGFKSVSSKAAKELSEGFPFSGASARGLIALGITGIVAVFVIVCLFKGKSKETGAHLISIAQNGPEQVTRITPKQSIPVREAKNPSDYTASPDIASMESTAIKVLQRRGTRFKSPSWGDSSDGYMIDKGSFSFYIAKVDMNNGQWGVLVPAPEKFDVGEKQMWQLFCWDMIKEITGVEGMEVFSSMKRDQKPFLKSGWHFSSISKNGVDCIAFCPAQFVGTSSSEGATNSSEGATRSQQDEADIYAWGRARGLSRNEIDEALDAYMNPTTVPGTLPKERHSRAEAERVLKELWAASHRN